MQKTSLIAGLILSSFLAASLVLAQQAKQQTGPQEQPGPFGFPGVKHLTEVLKLTTEQANGVHHIFSEYQKKEHQAQQEAAKEAAKDKTAGSKPPRVDTKALHDDMVNEIKTILTEEQKKKLDDMLADMGKKKKKAN